MSPVKPVLGILAVVVLVVVSVLAVRSLPTDSGNTKQDATQAQQEPSEPATATDSTQPAATNGDDTGSNEDKGKGKKTVEPATVDVMMIGDILMHDELVDSGLQADGTYDFGFIYDHITDEIQAADIRILNQETVMGDPSLGHHLYMGAAGPIMNTPTALADTEAEYGFNVILKATNHTLDLGYDGLGHELDYWKANHPEMPVLGVNNPNAAQGDDSQNYVDNVYVVEKNGMKIGILNYTWATNENFDWDTDHRYISYMSEQKIAEDVQKARDAGAEMLIACPHWGIEYDTTPSEEEYTYSKIFCDLGVDVIFGCHPHILQPVELLQNADGHQTVCFYSMGNFVAASIMQAYSFVGGVARVTMQREADGTYHVTAASMLPTVICNTYGPNMSAFPISEWTQDLANQSTTPELSPDYAYSLCSNVLGDGFDPEAGEYTLDLTADAREV